MSRVGRWRGARELIVHARLAPTPAAIPSFTPTSIELHDPPPKPKVLYDKSIQTSEDLNPSVPSGTHSLGTSTDVADTNGAGGGVGRESADEMRVRIIAELEEERKKLDAEIEEEKRRAAVELEEERAKGLSPPALSSVLASPPFLDFLSHSSKIVQRALSDSYDYLRDYTVSSTEASGEADNAKVRLLGSWYEERWGRGRSVTGVDWSPKVRSSSSGVA